jgi:capsule polysaccharide export protein KpsE/RkpR
MQGEIRQEWLSSTVEMLIRDSWTVRTATNTIAFIDSTLIAMESQLKETGNELKSFRKGKNIYDIEEEEPSFLIKCSNLMSVEMK